jgi:hypothetical protein
LLKLFLPSCLLWVLVSGKQSLKDYNLSGGKWKVFGNNESKVFYIEEYGKLEHSNKLDIMFVPLFIPLWAETGRGRVSAKSDYVKSIKINDNLPHLLSIWEEQDFFLLSNIFIIGMMSTGRLKLWLALYLYQLCTFQNGVVCSTYT